MGAVATALANYADLLVACKDIKVAREGAGQLAAMAVRFLWSTAEPMLNALLRIKSTQAPSAKSGDQVCGLRIPQRQFALTDRAIEK